MTTTLGRKSVWDGVNQESPNRQSIRIVGGSRQLGGSSIIILQKNERVDAALVVGENWGVRVQKKKNCYIAEMKYY